MFYDKEWIKIWENEIGRSITEEEIITKVRGLHEFGMQQCAQDSYDRAHKKK